VVAVSLSARAVSRVAGWGRSMRVLGVDHGEKRIGLALSDPTGTIASPLMVIEHASRLVDAAQVAALAAQHDAELIVVGQSFDEEGLPNRAGRSAERFADVLKSQTQTPIVMWDESFSTQDARARRIAVGVSRKKRAGHLDELAAAMILQSYLESLLGHER
jgi:putative Holliday junction resolvase